MAFTWLSLLPHDPFMRITSFLSTLSRPYPILFLCIACPDRSAEAFSLMKHELYLVPHLTPLLLCFLVDSFAPSLRVLGISDVQSEDVEIIKGSSLLTAAPMLRRVELLFEQSLMQRVAVCYSIKELAVTMAPHHDRDVLFGAISIMNLESLALTCSIDHDEEQGDSSDEERTDDDKPCLFKDPKYFRNDRNALSSCCPKLSKLSLRCGRKYESSLGGFQVLFGLHPLWELDIWGEIPESVCEEIFEVETVRLWRASVDCGLLFYTALAALHSTGICDQYQLFSLSGFPKLQSLELTVVEGMEPSFPKFFPTLPLLERISLTWDEPESDDEMELEDPAPEVEEEKMYARPKQGILSRSFSLAPKLRHISLSHVILSLKETEKILKCTGARLQSLELPISQQSEQPFERLEDLLFVLSKNNIELHSFECCELSGRDSTFAPTDEEKIRVQRAITYLKKRAPFWNGEIRGFTF